MRKVNRHYTAVRAPRMECEYELGSLAIGIDLIRGLKLRRDEEERRQTRHVLPFYAEGFSF